MDAVLTEKQRKEVEEAKRRLENMRLRINGKDYEWPDLNKLTIGEARAFKRISGVAPDPAILRDPKVTEELGTDLFAAIVYLMLHREDPTITEDDVDAIEFENLDVIQLTPETPPADPQTVPPAGPGATADEPSGSSETTLETSGLLPSPASTPGSPPG